MTAPLWFIAGIAVGFLLAYGVGWLLVVFGRAPSPAPEQWDENRGRVKWQRHRGN